MEYGGLLDWLLEKALSLIDVFGGASRMFATTPKLPIKHQVSVCLKGAFCRRYCSVNVPDSLEFTSAIEVATNVPEIAVINVSEKTTFEALESSALTVPLAPLEL